MWKKRVGGVLAVAFLICFLSGCAGTLSGPQDTEVVTYESVALALNTAKGYIKGQELSGALKGAELDATIAKWEQARQLFLKAGDALKDSIVAPTPADRATKLQQYNQMLMQAGQMAGQLKGGK